MASAALNVAAHSMPPPYTIPVGPRIRPPRLLPGMKAENTNPQPSGPVPHNAVWVQGKWRNPASNAAKDQQLLQSKRVEKALRHHTHGMNIYAYKQIRTNQVVYSLSRVMQNNKILPQLIFHRKKTVPAALRRDVWRPYFSIHFPQTPAGAQAGLRAYQLLRELALKRQLSPPRELLIATQDDVDKGRKRFDPANLRDMLMSHHVKDLPRLNQMLPARFRAKKLMDQKATSVADAAYVLGLFNEEESPADKLAKIEAQRMARHKERTVRNRKRVNEIRERQTRKAEEIEARQQLIQIQSEQSGQFGLGHYAAGRIAMEYGGAVLGKGYVRNLQDIQVAKEQTAQSQVPSVDDVLHEIEPPPFDAADFRLRFTEQWNEQYKDDVEKPGFPVHEMEDEVARRQESSETEMKRYRQQATDIAASVEADRQSQEHASRVVQVLWADKRDGTYAESWPESVYHGWLDPKAVLKRELTVVRQQASTDADGLEISEQKQNVLVQESTSPHVFGRDDSEEWFKLPSKQQEEAGERSKSRNEEWSRAGRESAVKRMIELRYELLSSAAEGSPLIQDEQTSQVRQAKRKLQALNARYPSYKTSLDEIDELTDIVVRAEELRRAIDDYKASSFDGEAPSTLESEGLGTVTQKDRIEELDELDNDLVKWSEKYPDFAYFEIKRWSAEQALLSDQESDPGQSANLEGELTEATNKAEEVKVDLVLETHRKELVKQGDDAAEMAAISPRSPAPRREDPAEVELVEHDKLGMPIEQEAPRMSVWGRLKSMFGR